MGLWHQCVWKKAEIPGQGFRKEHLECCYVQVQVRQGIFQAAGIPLQSWQLPARSCKYWAHSIGKAITMKVVTLLVFFVCCGSHLVHRIYLGLSLHILTSIFWYIAVIALSVAFTSGFICRWTVMEIAFLQPSRRVWG